MLFPRGADAPRSYFAERTFAGEKTIFAVHERTFARAAGVSPPWCGNAIAIADAFFHDRRQPAPGRKRRLQRQRAGFPRFEFAYRLHPTGGLRPPLLRCSANICQRKNDFCGARTHIRVKSGGRQPAVVSKNASAMAGDFRGVITFATARPASAPRLAYASRSWLYAGSSSYMHGCDLQRCFVSHGGLTPPALTLQCERLPAKNDFCDARTHIHKSGGREPAVVCDTYDVQEEWSAVQVRPNRHQERRASARRGTTTDAGKSAVSHKRRIVRRAMRSESSAARHQGGLYPAPMQAQRGCTTSGCAIDRLASSPERRTCSAE
jgi:hypothetical protein